MNPTKLRLKSLLLSIWVTVSCCINLQIVEAGSSQVGRFFQNALSMQPFQFLHLILFLALVALFQFLNIQHHNSNDKIISIVLAVLFSLFLLVGYSYETTHSMALIYGLANGQSLKALLYLSGHIILFYYLISYLYDRFDAVSNSTSLLTDTRTHFFSNNVFRKVVPLLFACYTPYIVASYPAIFMNDECFQILETYGVVSLKYLEGHLLNDAVTLNQHFPIAHTLYMATFVRFGVWAFSSANIGIFLYCMIQMLFLFVGVAYFIKVLEKEFNLPQVVYWAILAYFVISPRVHNYMMVTAKDVLYSGFLLLFLSFLVQFLRESNTKVASIGLALSSLGLYLNRNDARYLLILFFLFVIIFYRKKYLKFALSGIAAVAIITVVLSSVVFPHFDITPGTKAEMFSIPFQQTARYVRDYGDEVTAEEKEAISGILDYDSLATVYNPSFADPVKLLYDLDSDSIAMKTYFRTWFSMFQKHPAVYLSATIDNYYEYLYPSKVSMEPRSYEYSQRCFDINNPTFEQFGVHFSYPLSLSGYRQFYQSACRNIERFFPLNVLTIAATFNWLLILLMGYHLSRRNKDAFTLLLYPSLVMLLVFVSPCNGYFCRYTYPLILVAPLLISSLLLNEQNGSSNKKTLKNAK